MARISIILAFFIAVVSYHIAESTAGKGSSVVCSSTRLIAAASGTSLCVITTRDENGVGVIDDSATVTRAASVGTVSTVSHTAGQNTFTFTYTAGSTAGADYITVTVNGAEIAGSPVVIELVASPTAAISSRNPTVAVTSASQILTITGSHFLDSDESNGITVPTIATDVTVTNEVTRWVSDTMLIYSFTAPASTGLVTITISGVTTNFTVGAAPTITAVSPTSSDSGSLVVTLTGTNFVSDPSLKITYGATGWDAACVHSTFVSATELHCVMGDEAPYYAPTRFVVSYGAVSSADAPTVTFTPGSDFDRISTVYPTPSTTRLSPDFGSQRGATVLTIWGSGFVDAPSLQCGFVDVDANNNRGWLVRTKATYVRDSVIMCKTPVKSFGLTKTWAGAGGIEVCANPTPSSCSTRVIVSNDGNTWSAYPWNDEAASLLYYTWYPPQGTVASGAYTGNITGTSFSLDNSTGTLEGGTEVTITQTIASGAFPSASMDMMLPSQFLSCGFDATSTTLPTLAGPTYRSPAQWIGFTDTLKTKMQIKCTTPPVFSQTLSDQQLNVYFASDGVHWVDTGVDFNFTAASRNVLAPTLTVTSNHDETAWPARGPLKGNTEVTIQGKYFAPSNKAYCAFVDPFETCGAPSQCDGYGFGWTCCQVDSDPTHKYCCARSAATYVQTSTAGVQQYRCMSREHPAFGGITAQYQYAPGFVGLIRLSFADTVNSDDATQAVNLHTGGYLPRYHDLGTVATDFRWTPVCSSATACATFVNGYKPLMFLQSDIIVSVDGSDATGDGTIIKPYRTVQKAIDMALYNQRDGVKYQNGPAGLMYGQPAASGGLQQFNPDTIMLRAGVYRGQGNKGIRPRGKLLVIRAEETGNLKTVIDCEGTGEGFLIQSPQQFWDNNDNTDRESIQVINITPMRCGNQKVYTIYDPVTKAYIPYNNPMRSLAGATYLEPRTWNTRPGRSTPGQAVTP